MVLKNNIFLMITVSRIEPMIYSSQKNFVSRIKFLLLTLFFWPYLVFAFTLGATARDDFPLKSFVPIDPARLTQAATTPRKSLGRYNAVPTIFDSNKRPTFVTPPGQTQIKFILQKVIITGSSIYDAKTLASFSQDYLGKEITFNDLMNIADSITGVYRKDGYILSKVIIPQQAIKNGEVTLQVVEGYIANVVVLGTNSTRLKKLLMSYGEKLKQSRPLRIEDLERNVLLADDAPGYMVKVILSPSTNGIGATDLAFTVEDKKSFGFVAEFDNRGSRYMGPEEGSIDLGIYGLLSPSDEFKVFGFGTPTNEVRYLRLGYDSPIGASGLQIGLSGDYIKTHPGFILTPLGLVGKSTYLLARFSYPLLRSRRINFWLNGIFNYLDTRTDFTETLFNDHIRSLRFGITMDFIDYFYGVNTANLQFSKGMHILGASENGDHNASRPGAFSDYDKLTFDFSRLQALGNLPFSLLLAFQAQNAFHNSLLSAEEFAFGGSNFGRGYDLAEISGDSGIAGKIELQWNTNLRFKLLRYLQYYLFCDTGRVWNYGAENYQESNANATSAGIGARFGLSKYVTGNLELAKPLSRSVQAQLDAGKDGRALRFYFGLQASF
jgi:hemolysin activation/secretion protein